MPIVRNDLPPGKRALALFGSPHRQGRTGQLLEVFRRACPKTLDWTVWTCFDHAIHPCDDCRYCYRRGGCSKPDLEDFYPLLEAADLLVVATPVYNLSYSAPLKILMDRTQRYWAARFIRGEKPPIARPKRTVLLTAADVDRQGGEMVERQLCPTLTVLNAPLAAGIHVLAQEAPAVWRPQVEKAAKDLTDTWLLAENV